MKRIALAFALLLAACSGTRTSSDEVIIGLITKTDTNPFFVKMKEGAEAEAARGGARLIAAAGRADSDNASQVTAIENMVAAGVRAILITPSDAKAIVPAVRRAQAQGVLVLALDSPTDPIDAADALFATDNYEAGILIGRYAKAALGDRPPRVVTLDLFAGHPVGAQRHNGFMRGLGLPAPDRSSNELGADPAIVCQADSYGDQARGQTGMENCLQKSPEVNLVYTINEPTAAGAYTALRNAGRAEDVLIVSVDGGCEGVRNVERGVIAATAQQYPLKMAALGVAAALEYVATGVKPSGYTDTGVALITATPAEGVESERVEVGLESCWGQ
ncbi:MAG: sugar ABC transporter substrate-binding protein [Gemmatimonadota bacterium]